MILLECIQETLLHHCIWYRIVLHYRALNIYNSMQGVTSVLRYAKPNIGLGANQEILEGIKYAQRIMFRQEHVEITNRYAQSLGC